MIEDYNNICLIINIIYPIKCIINDLNIILNRNRKVNETQKLISISEKRIAEFAHLCTWIHI